MLGSTKDDAALPSGGANKQTDNTSHTVLPIGQTEPGVVAPNPIASKSTPNGVTVSATNPTGTGPGNTTTRCSKRVRVLPKTLRSVDPATGSQECEFSKKNQLERNAFYIPVRPDILWMDPCSISIEVGHATILCQP